MNGKQLQYDGLRGSTAGFHYDASRVMAVISTGPMPIDKGVTVEIELAQTSIELAGLKGVLSRANIAKSALDAVQGTPGFFDASKGSLERLSTLGDRVEGLLASGDMNGALDALNDAGALHSAALAEISDTKENDHNRLEYAIQLLTTTAIES